MVLDQHHLAFVAADGEDGQGFAGDFAGELGWKCNLTGHAAMVSWRGEVLRLAVRQGFL